MLLVSDRLDKQSWWQTDENAIYRIGLIRGDEEIKGDFFRRGFLLSLDLWQDIVEAESPAFAGVNSILSDESSFSRDCSLCALYHLGETSA